MSTDQRQQVIQQVETMIANNSKLISEVNKMKPEDQKVFFPVLEKSLKETHEILQSLKN